MWLLLVFLAVPILEIALFVQFGGHIGVIGTLAEIFLTAAIGLVLLRLEPQRNIHEVRAALDRQDSPASPLAHSALRLIGGILLVLPGFFTDALGLLLLIPPVRMLVLVQVLKSVKTPRGRAGAVIIEGEYDTQPKPEDPERPRLPDRDGKV
ncbi:MAG: FxsA family protein [Roseinatronobacter sp.]